MQACKARVFSSSSFPQPFRNECDLVYLLFSVFTWRQQQFKLRNYRFFGVSILSSSIPTLKHLYFTNFTWVCPSVFISRFERDLNPIRDGLHCWYQMVVCLSRRTRQLRLKSTKGSLIKQRRRRRQREQQKSNRFRSAKQQLCTHITLFVTFFCRRCTCATWNLPNFMFCRGREHKTKALFSFPKLCWYRITSVERSVLINRVRFYPELSLEISMYLPVFKGQF